MAWAVNPVFKPKQPPAVRAPSDVEAAQASAGHDGSASARTSTSPGPGLEPKAATELKFLPPSDHFTPHQISYLIIPGIVSAIIAGGINFAIAYALYHDKGSHGSPIRLFKFPNTLAGDTAVTTFIQFLTTWIPESIIVNYDLKRGGVQPIGFIPEPPWRYVRWYMFLDRRKQTQKVSSLKHWLRYLWSQVLRSLILAVASFPFIFGVSVGVLTPFGHHEHGDWDWYYSSAWAPEIFKLAQGAVLGLLFTPLMVMFWMTRCGWALLSMEKQSGGSRGVRATTP
ncbi:hypothetical protein F5Y14DRAFT_304496 [Nemania sp. NC0429]|nr:hypothetical protein F5Y14DRAFT_304496 [Nemania sp. NC0429]